MCLSYRKPRRWLRQRLQNGARGFKMQYLWQRQHIFVYTTVHATVTFRNMIYLLPLVLLLLFQVWVYWQSFYLTYLRQFTKGPLYVFVFSRWVSWPDCWNMFKKHKNLLRRILFARSFVSILRAFFSLFRKKEKSCHLPACLQPKFDT